MRKIVFYSAIVITFTGGSVTFAQTGYKAPIIEAPEYTLQKLRAKSDGMAVRTVKVLNRIDGPGNKIVISRIYDNMHAFGFSKEEVAHPRITHDAKVMMMTGPNWMIHVAGNGRYGRMWRSVLNDTGIPLPSRMSYSEVIAACSPYRQLIANTIGISVTEPVQILRVAYIGRALMNSQGAYVQSEVLGSFVTYSRVIDGIPVVGYGSQLKIGIDTNGRLMGFDFDWSEFEPTRSVQVTVDQTAMLKRLRHFASHVSIDDAACGYFDKGTQGNHTLSLLQPACWYRIKSNRGLQEFTIPAGAVFAQDPAWSETLVLPAD